MTRPREFATTAGQRFQVWTDAQDPAAGTGVVIGWVRRYRAADGQLYALLLTAYLFMTFLPMVIVFSAYVYDDPLALANRFENRMNLDPSASKTMEAILTGASGHKLTAVLLAVVSLFFFGLGFGQVLQLVHVRSWGFDLKKSAVDKALHLEVLGVLSLLALVYVFQSKALGDQPGWVGVLVALGWLVVLVVFFTYVPWRLLRGRVAARDVLPGALFTVAGFAAARLISSFLLRRWLEWYSVTYGGFGFVMAIFFWLVVLATIMVLAAGLSPALAQRRDSRAT